MSTDTPPWAYCTASGCVCNRGTVLDPVSERCVLLPGSQRFTEPDRVGLVAAVGQAEEGALLFAKYRYQDNHYVNSLSLQRVDASGARIGEAQQLWSAAETQAIDSVALASDGTRYLYCGSSQRTIRCGLFDPAGGVRTELLEAAGQSVAVAFTQATWLVAYRSGEASTDPSAFILQRFTREGQPQGEASSMPSSDSSGNTKAKPLLTATDDAFILVAPNPAADYREHVYWLSPELVSLRDPVDLGHRFWAYGSVAALSDLVAVTLSAPYTSALSLVDGSGALKDYVIPGGVKLGPIEALTATSQTIVASWFTAGPALTVQTLRSLGDRPAVDASASEQVWSTFRVGQGVLGARPIGQNGSGGDEIELVPLTN